MVAFLLIRCARGADRLCAHLRSSLRCLWLRDSTTAPAPPCEVKRDDSQVAMKRQATGRGGRVRNLFEGAGICSGFASLIFFA